MLLVTSTAEADAKAKTIDVLGSPYVLREYFGRSPTRGVYVEGNESNDDGLPQGFLVDQPPGATTRPHFHEQHQFQVFVGGSGRFGKRDARPVTVQYASAHTPYGPIVSGGEGVRYFTLRQRWDPGAKYMPQMRDRLVRGRQRQHLVPGVAVSAPAVLAARRTPALDVLVGPEADGLLAAVLRLGPDASAPAPDAGEGGGQYHLAVAGSFVHEGAEYAVDSCQFAFPDEGAVGVTAGPGGLEMLVLRFPAG